MAARRTSLALGGAAATLLAAAFTPVAAQAPTGGTIEIGASAGVNPADRLTAALADAVAEAFTRRGFLVLPDHGHAAVVAELAVDRADAGTGSARVSAAPPQAFGGGFGGAGASVAVPFGRGTRSVPLQRIQLRLTLRKRGADAVIWQGAAATVRPIGAHRSDEASIARDLTAAILAPYPAQAAGIAGVP